MPLRSSETLRPKTKEWTRFRRSRRAGGEKVVEALRADEGRGNRRRRRGCEAGRVGGAGLCAPSDRRAARNRLVTDAAAAILPAAAAHLYREAVDRAVLAISLAAS